MGQGSSLCPDAPSIPKKIIEHIFDAYVDKLPDHGFGEQLPPPPTTGEVKVGTTIDTHTGAHQESGGADVVKGYSSSLSIGQNSVSRLQSPLRHELSGGASDGGRGAEGLAGVEGGGGGGGGRNNTTRVSDNTGGCGGSGGNGGGTSTQCSRFSLSWVASDEGELGPHTGVPTRNAEWATVARDVRFRLASAWLSCDQVYATHRQYAGSFFSLNLGSSPPSFSSSRHAQPQLRTTGLGQVR